MALRLVSGLMARLAKRSRSEAGFSPSSDEEEGHEEAGLRQDSPASSHETLQLALGAVQLHSNAKKRRRLSSSDAGSPQRASAGTPMLPLSCKAGSGCSLPWALDGLLASGTTCLHLAACPPCRHPGRCLQEHNNPLAGPVFANNPLFEFEADEEVEHCVQSAAQGSGSYFDRGFDQENSGVAANRYAPCVTPQLHRTLAGDSQDEFAEFGLEASRSPGCSQLLSAFMQQLQSMPVLCALANLERYHMLPVGEGGFSSVEHTAAGMLLLCRRAKLGDTECSPEMLLTLLWLLESSSSQYRSHLNECLLSYLSLHPQGNLIFGVMHSQMLGLQIQVLKRCSWKVLLLDPGELRAALQELEAQRCFTSLCRNIRACSRDPCLLQAHLGHSRELPPGTLGGSRGRAKAAPVLPHHQPLASRLAAAAGSLASSLWQQAPAVSKHATRAGVPKGVLGPHNTQ